MKEAKDEEEEKEEDEANDPIPSATVIQKKRCECGVRRAFYSIFPPGVARAQLFPLLLLNFCESYSSSSVMTYSGFLVLDFVPGVDERTIGKYSGWLASAYFLMQMLSSPLLGALSDRLGRKPLLLAGTAGNCLSTMMLGFSFNYPWAVCARALNGALNGNIATIKAFAADLTSDAASRNAVFSNLLLFSGLGGVFGGAIGGALARPAQQYPSVFFPTGLFARFPYLLPNIVSAVLLLAALVLSTFFVHDSAKKKPVKKSEQEEGLVSSSSSSSPSINQTRKKDGAMCCFFCRSTAQLAKPGRKIAFATCAFYAVFGFANTCFRTALPVWSMSPCENGGVSFSARTTGLLFTIAGVTVIPIQLCVYPAAVRKLRLLWCFRVGCVAISLAFAATPFLSRLCGSAAALFWTVLGLGCTVWMLGSQLGFASINTVISNSVPHELSGMVNGVGQSFVALGRTIGPISFSPLLAWSMTNGHGFPLNVHFPFLLVALVPLAAGLLSWLLPPALNSPKIEADTKVATSPAIEMDEAAGVKGKS